MEIPTSPAAPPETPRPAPRAHVWARRRGLTVGLTALALVAGGGAAIAAGRPSTDTGASGAATDSAQATPGKAASGFGGLLHSESVVADGKGGYVTRLTQTGTIESIDAERLTVVSEDGYRRSWTRNADTAVGGAGWRVTKNDDGSWTVKKDTGDLATGDDVMVVGTLADDVATATRITTVPRAGEIPGAILRRLEGDRGRSLDERARGLGDLRDRLRQRFEDGPGPELRRFEFPMPGRGAREAVPVPPTATPTAPGSGAVPAEPSWATSPASFA